MVETSSHRQVYSEQKERHETVPVRRRVHSKETHTSVSSTCAMSALGPPSASASASALAPPSAAASASTSTWRSEDVWTWTDHHTSINPDNTVNAERWHWHFVSDAQKSSAWTTFSPESSLQLQSVCSQWSRRTHRKYRLRLETGDEQLSNLWQELGNDGHKVECIIFDGRHGGLMQVTASTPNGWLELCRVRTDAKTEYPWIWNRNSQAKT